MRIARAHHLSKVDNMYFFIVHGLVEAGYLRIARAHHLSKVDNMYFFIVHGLVEAGNLAFALNLGLI